MIEQLNAISEVWWGWMAGMFWQVGLLILLIACIDRLVRKWAWPQLRYALWSLILIKLILPPTTSLPSGVVPELRPVVGQAVQWMESARPVGGKKSIDIANLGLETIDLARREEVRPAAVIPAAPAVPAAYSSSAIHDVNSRSAIAYPPLQWQVYAMVIWLVGIIVLGIWLGLRLHSLIGRNRYAAAAASLPQSFYNQLAGCAKRLGLRRVPQVVVVRRLATPAVFGVFRPVLLMPKRYLSKLSRRDTEHMLLHELAHIQRGDLHMHGLYMLLQILYWYNPLLWLVRRQLHHLRELSCDATVAELLREQTTAYRQTLLETARRFLARSTEPGLGLLGLFEDANRLVVRLRWLEKPTWRYRNMKRLIVATVAVAMFACVLPMAQQAQANAVADNETSEQQYNEQVSRELAELQVKLEKLELERLKLQKELRAMAPYHRQAEEARKVTRVEVKKSKDAAAKAASEAKKAAAKARKMKTYTVQPGDTLSTIAKKYYGNKEDEQSENVARIVKANQLDGVEGIQVGQRLAIPSPAHAHTGMSEQWAEEMEAWAEEMEQWRDGAEMEQWQEAVEHWQNSDAFKSWQKQMQEWGEAQGRAYSGSDDAVPPVVPAPPMPPMPVMPAMPAMPGAPGPMPTPVPHPVAVPGPEISRVNVVAPGSRMSGVAVATPAPSAPFVVVDADADADADAEGSVSLEISADASADGMRMVQAVKERKEGDHYVIARAEQTTMTLASGSALNLINDNGTIAIAGSDGDGCHVQSAFAIKAPALEAARKLSKAVHLETRTTEKGVSIIVAGPAKMPRQHSAQVDLQVLVPRNTHLSIKHGDGTIRIKNIEGRIAAFLEDGAVRCEDVEGVLAVRVEDGRAVIERARLAACSIHMEDGQITCDDFTGSLDIHLEDGSAKVTYGDDVPEDCEIKASLEDGSIKLSAPSAMFPPDVTKAKRRDDGAEWDTTVETATGSRTVTLRVEEGSIKVEKR
jgi:beta-lactamase regulating signal transducer with metallopeptidase domain/LysM repeat protein